MGVLDTLKSEGAFAALAGATMKLLLVGCVGSVLICLFSCMLLKNTLVQVWYDFRRDHLPRRVAAHYPDQPVSGGPGHLQRRNQP